MLHPCETCRAADELCSDGAHLCDWRVVDECLGATRTDGECQWLVEVVGLVDAVHECQSVPTREDAVDTFRVAHDEDATVP